MPIIKTIVNGRPAEVKVKSPFVHSREIVAIDPDTDKNGVASVIAGDVNYLKSLDYFDLIPELKAAHERGAAILIEDIDDKSTTRRRRGTNNREHAAIAQKVGRVKNAAGMIIKTLDRERIPYTLIKPLAMFEKKAAKDAKGAAQFFADLTGWSGRTNPDQRDAAIIALYGLEVLP